MKQFVIIAVAFVLAVVSVQPVAAHVLLQDTEAKIGAVVHVTPDDSPIAGEPSELYFDIQDGQSDVRIPYDGYELFITDTTGERQQIETFVDGSSVGATYTFPVQGLYQLELQPKEQYEEDISLASSIRITRGAGSLQATETYVWAQAGLVFGVTLLVLLAITAANKRSRIVEQSKW